MITLLCTTLAWGNDLETLPAKIAGTTDWPGRQAVVLALIEDEADDDRRARLTAVGEVLALLEDHEPRVARARLRTLVAAAISADPVPRVEAIKAATLGVDLPEIPDGADWFRRVPAVAGELSPIVLEVAATDPLDIDPASAEALLVARAGAVGWPLQPPADDAPIRLVGQVASLYGAIWGDQPGFGVDVQWALSKGDEPLYQAVTRGFDAGPLDPASPDRLLEASLFNLLAQPALLATLQGSPTPADAEHALERRDLGTLCLYRRKHQDNRPLVIELGGQSVPVLAATWGCIEVADGTTVHSQGTPGAPTALAAGQRQVMQVAHAESAGWALLLVEDGAAMDKLVAKGKLTEVELIPEP